MNERSHLISPLTLSRTITNDYHNASLTSVNDHEIRMSVMTGQFRWRRHPDSDETFRGVDGKLVIEFEDHEVVIGPREMITVLAGTLHRTRPHGERSVNLPFERVDAATIFEQTAATY